MAFFRRKPRLPEQTDLFCSFCGKRQRDVFKLIAGPSVFICDRCIDICNQIIAEDRAMAARVQGLCSLCQREAAPDRSLTTPGKVICPDCLAEIRRFLASSEEAPGTS